MRSGDVGVASPRAGSYKPHPVRTSAILLLLAAGASAAETASTTVSVGAAWGLAGLAAGAGLAGWLGWRAVRAQRADAVRRAAAAAEIGARAATFFDDVPLGAVTIGANGRIRTVNAAFERLAGRAAADCTGRFWRDLLAPEEVARDDRAVREVAEGGFAAAYTAACVRPDDGRVVVEVHRRRLAGGGGVIWVQEVGPRLTAEAAAQRAQARLDGLAERLPDALLRVIDGRITAANPAAKALCAGDPCGLAMAELVGPESSAVLRALLAEGGSAALRLRRRDGAARTVRAVAVPGADGCDLVLADLTDSTAANTGLQTSEQRFRALADPAAVGVWQLDGDGRTVYANAALCALLGVGAPADLGARGWLDFLAPESRETFARDQARDGGPAPSEIDLVTAGGLRRRVLACTAPLRGADGALLGLIGSFLDLSDRRSLEDQLRQAQKTEAMGRLAGGLAHDFHNLLTVITGYGEVHLRNLASNDPRRKGVEHMLTAARRASSMTQQLLALSRQQAAAPALVDLNAVLAELEPTLRRLVGDRVELVLRTGERLGRITVDRQQIEQVVLTLAVNARDAMPQGGQVTIETDNAELDEIYTRLQPAVKPGSCVMLSVADTGVGMDPETQAHVFEPFFTTKPGKEPGVARGLGLATVYGIVQAAGGNIWFTSAPGKGTVFKAYFPRVEPADEPVAPAPAEPSAQRPGETILLVEDEVDVRELIAEMLTSEGYRIIPAANGREALRQHEQHGDAIDLVLTDVVMPQMNGPELGEELARRAPDLRVLYMSGYLDRVIVRSDVNDPRFLFLEKPFTAAALLRKVREALDRPTRA